MILLYCQISHKLIFTTGKLCFLSLDKNACSYIAYFTVVTYVRCLATVGVMCFLRMASAVRFFVFLEVKKYSKSQPIVKLTL